jgi:hypothetical protein
MSLWSEFVTNEQRVIHKWKHYFPIYEHHFGRFVNRPLTFWEIGAGQGGSLQMWKRYFGPHVQVVGLDLREICKTFEEDQIAVRIGDQADTKFLESVIKEFGAPDVVLDDGSHRPEPTAASFRFLYPRLDRNGVYAVEDLHTAYWEEWGGGLQREGTFIELCKGLIDELHQDYIRPLRPRAATDFARTTLSMHFYDSVVVFERCQLRTGKGAPMIGKKPDEP